ncbi:MAG: VWA domain-containing protein [Devosia sp.]|nr:VWA domain-containing protein [Devosia sp.]
MLRTLVAVAAIALGVAVPAAAADRAIIILDGSGSMWAQIEGKARIEIARETLDRVLSGVPVELELGLMSYGHREKGACDDIEMLVEPAAGTGPAISAAAAAISPKGKTPISDAVRQAAEGLRYTEDKATVILITDGLETCEADPCALASELESQGLDFTTHVVGFGLTREEGEQVACLAENTGGRYIAAGDEATLAEALTTTVAEVAAPAEPEPAPQPEPAALAFNLDPDLVLAEGGNGGIAEFDVTWELYRAAAGGGSGERLSTDYGIDWKASVDPGDYVLRASVGYAHVEQPVTVAETGLAVPYFVMNAGQLIIRPLPADGAEPDSSAAVYSRFPNGEDDTSYGETRLFVPAGDTEVKVTIGAGEALLTVPVKAGERVSRDVVVGIGIARVNGYFVEGMKVEDSGVFVEVFAARKDIQGNRRSVGYSYGPDQSFSLPPGDYVLVTRLGAAEVETPFTAVSGEAVEVNALLGAGVMAVTAPGSDFVEIFSARTDIQGNRRSMGYGYGGALDLVLPAGDYVVVARPTDGSADREASGTVVAGERLELSIE